MEKRGLSQESLKLIACITMFIDHIGAILVLQMLRQMPVQHAYYEQLTKFYFALRIIGRIAFPIYCFLLVEGAYHTRNPKKYGLRLFVGMLLSEIPFDLAFSLRSNLLFDWSENNVMVTLLLGFCMIEAIKRATDFAKVAVVLPFYLLAEWMKTDYGGLGILIIAVFALTRELPRERLCQFLALCLVVYSGKRARIGSWMVNLEWFAVLAMLPISCYDGRKLTRNKVAQWGFYLFYPAHLLLLVWLRALIFR